MSTDINQYAEKVYAEHPIAMWSLDEDAYYISLANDDARKFTNWTTTNCIAHDPADLSDIPNPPYFLGNIYSSIEKTEDTAGTIQAVSPSLFSPIDLDLSISTFCVNFFLYQNPTILSVKTGYEYTGTDGNKHQSDLEINGQSNIASWKNFNTIYQIPQNFEGNLKIIIEIEFQETVGQSDSSRTVIMHGFSVGQGSETTCFENLGSDSVTLPESANLSGMRGIPADQYGILAENAYYLIKDNKLLASNSGLPIIYGTDSSTKIYPAGSNLPSVIFPGKGMLNEAGRNKQYTLEMWIKIDPKINVAKKIIGPLSGTDGVYVKEGFITLVIGDEINSHYVSEWYRPMLIHLQLKDNIASMLINGEQVISVSMNRSTILLPNDNDWWGVYSYSSINMFSIDSISIYPYIVSDIIAKKRFVYGQGTPGIQSIDNGFSGTPITIDFPTSEYNSSIIYPDIARWDAGYFNNLNATKNYLSVPNYLLPNINIGGRDIQEWYRDNFIAYGIDYPNADSPYFITFKPNITYDINGDPQSWSPDGINYTQPSYFNFPSLSILNDAVVAVYGVFEAELDIEDQRTLISFANITTGQSFDITIGYDLDLDKNIIRYFINSSEIESARQIVDKGIECLVGINFELAGIEFGYDVSRFFSSPSSIQVYVGGKGIDPSTQLDTTFEGKIYSVGFCNQNNYEKIYTNFSSNGLAINNNYELLLDHIASYTLLPEREYSHLYLDISVSSEWEEYYPLTYFASYVKDENGNPIYDLDTLQMNIGYTSIESDVVWTYQQLNDAYATLDYDELANSVYDNYFNLKKNNTTGNSVSVSKSSLQSYITFQLLSDGANAPLSDFPYTKQISTDHIIDPDLENTDIYPQRAYQTKFVFVDNVIIYPPKTNPFEDYAMVVHFQIKQRSILKNPLKIKSFEISSRNMNYANSNADQRSHIGTKFGTKIYPEIDTYGIIDAKSKNPCFIYKTSTPYIYTTRKSGIRLLEQSSLSHPETIGQNKINIPVNKNGSYDFKVGALTLFMLADLADVVDRIPFIEIKHKTGTIVLALDKTETETMVRAYKKPTQLFVSGGVSNTSSWSDNWNAEYSNSLPNSFVSVDIGSQNISNTIEDYVELKDVYFYQNGRYVRHPLIKNNEWNAIGIMFPEQLDFGDYQEGAINLFGGFTFNNISYYLAEGLGIKADLNVRTWSGVLSKDINGDPVTPDNIWQYWSDETQDWQSVYVVGQSQSYLSTPSDIYNAYTGTNRYVIDDSYGLQLQQTQTSALTDVSWSVYTDKPA